MFEAMVWPRGGKSPTPILGKRWSSDFQKLKRKRMVFYRRHWEEKPSKNYQSSLPLVAIMALEDAL